MNIEVDFNSRHIQDSSGVLSLGIPDSVRAEKSGDTVEWALATLNAGGAIVILDDNGEDTECAIVAAAEKLTPEVLTFAVGMSRCGCTLGVGGSVAERLAIPAPVINKELDEEDRRYLVPINHLENKDNDFSSAAILKTITLFTDRKYTIGDWKCPGNVSAIQILSDEVDKRYGVLEGSVNILSKTEMIPVSLCMTLHAADGSRFDKDQAEAFAARFELPLVSLKQALEGYKFGS